MNDEMKGIVIAVALSILFWQAAIGLAIWYFE
jgi:hypothetical protein